MTPSERERYLDCVHRAKILSGASECYLKAAQAIDAGASEDERYRHIKSAKDQQHKRGTREYEDRIVKHIKAQGFSNPEGKKGTELIEAYQEWVKAQAIDDDGTGGKKPSLWVWV